MNRNKQLALEAFSGEAFLSVNKTLLQIYDPNTAVFLGNLVDKYRYFDERDMLVEKEWFFITYKKIQKQINLSDYQIRSCISALEEDGVIDTDKKGVPAKKHYRINWERLTGLISVFRSRSKKSPGLDLKKLKAKVLKILRSINENKEGEQRKENKEKNKKKRSLLDPPSNDDPLPVYSINSDKEWQNNQPIDFESFVEAFNEATGAKCRMTSGKKSDIKKQLKTFSGQEIKEALRKRAIILKDSEYLTSWESVFSRKVERMEKYLTSSPSKTKQKNTSVTYQRQDGHEYETEMEI